MVAELAQRRERLPDALHRRLDAAEEARTRLGETDAPGRALEQANADALLQRTDRLTDRRGGYPELRCGRGEAALLCDAEQSGEAGEVVAHLLVKLNTTSRFGAFSQWTGRPRIGAGRREAP